MDILLKGVHSEKTIIDSLAQVFEMFKDRYSIEQYREMYLTITLVDQQGDDVELVDTQTNEVFQRFVIVDKAAQNDHAEESCHLKLVVDNT